MVANIETLNPIRAITAKDKRKPDIPASTPTSGGPIRNPKKLMVDTDARAMPGDSIFDLPAALYTRGTIEDTPIPTNKNPKVAVYK